MTPGEFWAILDAKNGKKPTGGRIVRDEIEAAIIRMNAKGYHV
jgi:hypothetical protein